MKQAVYDQTWMSFDFSMHTIWLFHMHSIVSFNYLMAWTGKHQKWANKLAPVKVL